MATLKEDLSTIEFLREQRRPYEDTIEQIKELMMPWRFEINTKRTPGSPRVHGSFDSMAANEADKFVNFVVGNVFPPTGDWIRLFVRGSDDDLETRQRLDESTDELLQALAESNFYTQAAMALRDDVIVGNGYLYYEARTPSLQPDGSIFAGIDYEAVPFNRIWRLLDRHGRPIIVARQFKMRAFLAKDFFSRPGDSFSHSGDSMDEVELIVVTRREKNGVTTRWINMDTEKQCRVGTVSYMPYAISRWDCVDGEQYGVGRGHLARPTAAGRNELKRQILMAAGRDLGPTLLLEHDSIMNVDRASHAVMIMKPSVQNRPEYLNTNTNYAAAQQIAVEDAEQIRSAFLTDLIGEPDGIERSAEGSRQRQARVVQASASPAQNIATNFLAPVIEGSIGLMREHGKLAALDGLDNVEVAFVSPFFTLQKQQAVQKVADFINFKVNLQALAKRDDLLDDVDFDKASEYISKNSDIPAIILKDPTEARQARANVAAMDKAVEAASKLGAVPGAQIASQTPGSLPGLA